MAKITVDFGQHKAAMKPVHGVGQPPFVGADFRMFHFLKEAGIPYSRLHDVGGYYGGWRWVDIPNLFRDFGADPYDPASYDFTFTDLLINALMENGVEPFFRLGVTIENQAMIKSYRLDPPSDYRKWAVVCEHVIRHYTEGWADGFHHKITYWEIWNEPDNFEDPNENQMWKGTKEQYYELYDVASKHLKACFPHLKIGGYASCGFYAIKGTYVINAASSLRTEYFIEFLDGFLEYIKEHGSPIDFFSWHSYDGVKDNIAYAKYARQRLDEAGFAHVETSCNEWNGKVNTRGSFEHASETCAILLAFQDLPVDTAMFYDARFGTSIYGSLFHPMTAQPLPAYYAFTAFNRLYQLGTQAVLECDDDEIFAVAAVKEDQGCIVIANHTDHGIALDLQCGGSITECLITAEEQIEAQTKLPGVLPAFSILTVQVKTA